jgi:putative oxidoreductase
MSPTFRAPRTNVDAGLLVLRVILAVVLLFHGVAKAQHGIAWMAEPLGKFGLPLFVGYGAYVAELVAPVLLILGAWTRLAAVVIAFDMVMAVVLVLHGQLFAIKQGGGGWAVEVEALIFFAAVALALTGGGRYAMTRDA